ncbi:GAF and ANTAR domain-containing protein [Mycobacterium deserti]|uniref:GAF and ANTAR domain-containing protein n=1 Tax=Mycobacterium deserti TaxID=2978347 RepID=A0ABT2M7R9_9MYCO|nr:GAF and ANTAR domain-containing protein [Mycobacterium deserti]MCT7658308.1 GAF and ANTAR domain-containing protein [Mycobacterium deserti]
MADFDAQPGRNAPLDSELSSAQLEADEVDLYAGLRGVAGLVADARGLIAVLGEVAEFARRAIPGVEGAGVTLVDSLEDSSSVETWAVTAEFVERIDKAQYVDVHEGPCVTCMQSRRPTVSGSLGSDSRWPHFGGRVARMGVHSALALPLIVGDQVIGAVNAYAHHRDAFGEHAVELGGQFAGPAAASVYNAQLLARAQERTTQLQRALGSRAMIDQAIGIIRSRSGASAEEAFDRLTRLSQSENIKLAVVAERLVNESVRRARARQGV